MAAPTFSDNKPTGDYEKQDASILVSIAHATGVDETTVNMTLVDPIGTSAAAITNGVFDTDNDYAGDIKPVGTNADVILRSHDPFMAGTWTITVTADSDAGGEVGTKTWTFSVFGELSGVFQGIRELMEGKAGTGRTIPQNTFRYMDLREGDESRLAAAGETRPFLLIDLGPADAQDAPGNVSGDYVWDSSIIRMTVLYFVQDNAPFNLEQLMADQRKLIKRTMEWPRNFAAYEGWCGCIVSGISKEVVPMGESEKEDLILVHYDLEVQTREKHEY